MIAIYRATLVFFLICSSTSLHAQQGSASNSIVARDITNSNVYNGISDSTLQIILKPYIDRTDEQRRQVESLAELLNIREDQIHEVLVSLGQKEVPKEQFGWRLKEFAAQYNLVQTQLVALQNRFPTLAKNVGQIQNAIDKGQFETARQLIRQAQTDSQGVRPEAAILVEIQALTEGLQFNYFRSSALYLAATLLSDPDSNDYMPYQLEYARALLSHSVESTRKDDLAETVRALRAITLSKQFPLFSQASTVEILLGNALVAQWQSSSDGQKLLVEAKGIFNTLLLRSKEGSEDWLLAQNAIGSTFAITGDDASAVKSFRSVLDNLPAGSDEKLARGIAKELVLSELSGAMARAARDSTDKLGLEAALKIAQEATASDTSLNSYDRGQLRYNAGIAAYQLCALGGSLVNCQAAVDYFDQAIALLPQNQEPLSWAHSQTNKGITQLFMGDSRKNSKMLSDGVESIKASLTVWRPHESTHRWWQAKLMLAEGLSSLGELLKKSDYYELAAISMEDAIDYIDHDYESGNLLEARVHVADNYFVLSEQFKIEADKVEARSFYASAAKVMAERMVSGLSGDVDAKYRDHIEERLKILGEDGRADCVGQVRKPVSVAPPRRHR